MKKIFWVVNLVIMTAFFGCGSKNKQVERFEPYPYESPRFGKEKVLVEKHKRPVKSEPLAIPGFVLAVPQGHFAGISQPSPTVASARQSAIADIVGQVVGSMNSDAKAHYRERMQIKGLGMKHTVDDDVDIIAEGLVVGVEQNIVDAVIVTDVLGRYVCYLLVRYPAVLIEEMRRLSLGANLIPQLEKTGSGGLKIKVQETNNV